MQFVDHTIVNSAIVLTSVNLIPSADARAGSRPSAGSMVAKGT